MSAPPPREISRSALPAVLGERRGMGGGMEIAFGIAVMAVSVINIKNYNSGLSNLKAVCWFL